MGYPALFGFGLLLTAACALAGFSLRDFSYSRLEDLCERRGKPDRFREIRKQQEPALLALEFLLTALLGACFTAVAVWLGLERAAAAESPLDFWRAIGAMLALGGLIIVVVDLLPWVASRVFGEWILYTCWPAISVVRHLSAPLLGLAGFLDRLAHRATGRGSPEADDAANLGDELRTVVEEGEREGVIESDAGDMIHRVIQLQHDDVADIMTPRTQMFCIDVESSLDKARELLIESGHSRVPVIGESSDDIIGLLYAKDMLEAYAPAKPGDPIPILRNLLREPVYVPVTTQIPSLLELMKRNKVHIAIVLDEYGGVAGLVTMEDILEEIVGEIADEFDETEHLEQLQIVSESVAEVDAGVHLDDLNSRLHYGLPGDSEFDTIGGFLFSQLGRVPSVGEEVTWERLKFTVLSADKRRIRRLRIEVQGGTTPTEESAA
jgi:CBS domain containing-hemolysin-like protein